MNSPEGDFSYGKIFARKPGDLIVPALD